MLWDVADGYRLAAMALILRSNSRQGRNNNLGREYLYSGHYKSNLPRGPQNAAVTCLQMANHFDYQQYNLQQERMSFMLTEILLSKMSQMFSPMSDVLPTILLPPSAFLRPKYALWDCPRPAHASKWCQDCCRRFHAGRAINEGAPGMAPVLHRGGIDLKDELFDLCVLEVESLREGLLFDKPRRAFESGNRKQRSLPDYNGRGKETIMAEQKFDSNEMKDNMDHADQHPSPSIIEEVKLPEIGMIFSSEEEVHTFYNSYATNVGFGILKLEVQQLGAESDEICSVLVEIMKDTKEKLIIAMENGQSRAEQLKEASTSGAKVIHSPLKVRTKGCPPTKRKQSKVEQIVNKSLAKARKKGVASSDPNSGFS
ncbi:hypothetical protein ZIOFF_051263 [Zingiber officinale]|uniref:Uncharacterized protein n=1 Tax=Zingiber officinale TaxID=94328 RepID=A0A8J5FR35_ZINOF|nr:hypothetical protein ZIOFF_051263 [Zingiber officinale]